MAAIRSGEFLCHCEPRPGFAGRGQGSEATKQSGFYSAGEKPDCFVVWAAKIQPPILLAMTRFDDPFESGFSSSSLSGC
jgi:hypothetical protein